MDTGQWASDGTGLNYLFCRFRYTTSAQALIAIAFPKIPERVVTPILSIIKRKNALTVLGLIPIRTAISLVVRPPSERHCKTSCSRAVSLNFSATCASGIDPEEPRSRNTASDD